MNLFHFLLDVTQSAGGVQGYIFYENGSNKGINEIAKFLNIYIVPFTITLAVAGALMAIFVAAAMIREDDAGKARDYKKKLIGMISTVVIVISLVWVLGFLITSWPDIQKTFESVINANLIYKIT